VFLGIGFDFPVAIIAVSFGSHCSHNKFAKYLTLADSLTGYFLFA
jgi:hypothetical protein